MIKRNSNNNNKDDNKDDNININNNNNNNNNSNDNKRLQEYLLISDLPCPCLTISYYTSIEPIHDLINQLNMRVKHIALCGINIKYSIKCKLVCAPCRQRNIYTFSVFKLYTFQTVFTVFWFYSNNNRYS